MTTPDVGWLRKCVEWVETQDALPAIDCEWLQASYLMSPKTRALDLVSTALPWLRGNRNPEVVSRERNQMVARIEPYCGTAYCVAGWTAAQVDPRYRTEEVVDGVHSSEVARQTLGLTAHQAALLFSGSNDAAMVRRVAEQIAGEPL